MVSKQKKPSSNKHLFKKKNLLKHLNTNVFLLSKLFTTTDLLHDVLISDLYMSYRNTIQFTPTQIEAIRAGMQPGLTMVRTGVCVYLLNKL